MQKARWMIVSESILAISIFIVSCFIGYHSLQNNQKQLLNYTAHYEPAVMLACGRGYGQAQDVSLPSLQAFLKQKQPQFNCNDIPQSVKLDQHLAVGAWYYLMVALALIWKVIGVSWQGVYVLLTIFFAATTVIVFALYRLAMGPFLATLGSLLFALLPAHQQFLESVRDYSKAPFILLGIYLISLLALQHLNRKKLLAVCLLLGAVIGVGYGFRPDVLILIPPSIVTILFFIPRSISKILQNLLLLALLAGSFFITSYPVLTTYTQNNIGSCLWHFPLFGISTPFKNELNLKPSQYVLSYKYDDQMNYAMVNAYAQHQWQKPTVIPCSHEYDKASFALYRQILLNMPADFLISAYASVVTILKMLRASDFFAWQGVVLTIVLLLTMAAVNTRIAIFLLLAIFYFFAYPAIEFSSRHFFYLMFWYWVPIGFILHQLFLLCFNKAIRSEYIKKYRAIRAERELRQLLIARVLVYVFVIIAFIQISLLLSRWYQTTNLSQLITRYLQAKDLPLAYTKIQESATANTLYRFNWPRDWQKLALQTKNHYAVTEALMLHVFFANTACNNKRVNLTLKYATDNKHFDFSVYLPLNLSRLQQASYNLYWPLYFIAGRVAPEGIELPNQLVAGYSYPYGIEVASDDAACITAITLLDEQALPSLRMGLLLPANWQYYNLYYQYR